MVSYRLKIEEMPPQLSQLFTCNKYLPELLILTTTSLNTLLRAECFVTLLIAVHGIEWNQRVETEGGFAELRGHTLTVLHIVWIR